MTKAKENPQKGGRPSKYHTHIQPFLGAIAAMRRNGIAQEQIAEKFGVSPQTIIEYKAKFPEFAECLKTNAEVADMAVENALFQNAINGNLGAQAFWLKNRAYRKWRDRHHVFQQTQTTQKFEYDNLSDEELERELEELEKNPSAVQAYMEEDEDGDETFH